MEDERRLYHYKKKRPFARIHREWRSRFRYLRSKINSNFCSAALPPLTFLHFSAWCLCHCPSLFQRVSKNGMKDSVNYQIISPKDLAKSVLSEVGSSTFMANNQDKRRTGVRIEIIMTKCTKSYDGDFMY
ncbi:hypothetical protein Ahy_B10g105915 [Arachis hypogaea]|uniref:Uncharacterized protein n=1 Tax=Arachis hypogaea TaxID=3818 RepID=A0A444X969_ARAHY|nr:hypothetical protein Ahy_B10g105915 [Arachis hypogaea]